MPDLSFAPTEARRGRIALALFGAVAVAWVVAVVRIPVAYLTLTADDAFYYQEIAERLAAGQGSTFDGIAETNGYHPAFEFLLASSVRAIPGLSPDARMRLSIAGCVALFAFGVVRLSRLPIRGARLVPAIAALALTNFYVAKIVFNGMESSLAIAALALVWTRHADAISAEATRSDARLLERFLLGAMAGVLALARLDAVFFGVGLVMVEWILPSRVVRWDVRAKLARTLALGVGIACVLGPYLAWNLGTTGHLLPVSGTLKAIRPAERSAAIVVAASGIALGALLALRFARRADDEAHRVARIVAPLAVHLSVLTIYFALVRGMFVPEIWCLAPHLVAAIIVFASLLAARPSSVRSAACLGLAAGFVAFTAVGWMHRTKASGYVRYVRAAELGAFLDAYAGAGTIAAGWDAGIVAAHTDVPLVNLDGLVNSWDYAEHYFLPRRSDDYLRKVDATVIVQYFDSSVFEEPVARWRGVVLDDYRVVRLDCMALERAFERGGARRAYYLVLDREARHSAPLVRDVAARFPEFCEERETTIFAGAASHVAEARIEPSMRVD